jgi:hypothetical protein
MTVAVELDHELAGRAVEVGDITPERLLPRELVGQIAQQFIPELALGRSRIAAK